MAGMHTIEQGESLATIAKRNGFNSWQTLWDHPRNAELRSHRPTPDLIHPGDQVYIPDPERRDAPARTETTNQFVARVATTEQRIRSITILIHGVNTDAAWFGLVATEMGKHASPEEVPPGGGTVTYKLNDLILPFSWGDYEIRKQGGRFNYAVDEVHQMFEAPMIGYDRIYQGHAAVRMKELIDECTKLDVQINVIAHSNGTLETCGAMMLGCSIDNFIMMGSPLDCDNERSQNELKTATANVRDTVTNFWSTGDAVAQLKGGIGRFGNNAYYTSHNPQIRNVEFVKGAVLEGVTINDDGGHSNYMLADKMGIFSAYIRRFAATSTKRVPYDEEKVEKLKEAANWIYQPYYRDQRNISLRSPEMRKYEAEIRAITG